MARRRFAVFIGRTMAVSQAKVNRAARREDAAKKTFQKVKYFGGIPQMGDAAVSERGYLCVNLGDKEMSSGCSLRPT
jgi:hypothetical protein